MDVSMHVRNAHALHLGNRFGRLIGQNCDSIAEDMTARDRPAGRCGWRDAVNAKEES